LKNPDALVQFIRGQSKWLFLIVLAFAALYILSVRLSKKKS
jgi:hypothetical protein